MIQANKNEDKVRCYPGAGIQIGTAAGSMRLEHWIFMYPAEKNWCKEVIVAACTLHV